MKPTPVSGLVAFREAPNFLRGKGKKVRRKLGNGTIQRQTRTHKRYFRAQTYLKRHRVPTLSNTHARRAPPTSNTRTQVPKGCAHKTPKFLCPVFPTLISPLPARLPTASCCGPCGQSTHKPLRNAQATDLQKPSM